MPRTYVRKTEKASYDKRKLNEAVEAVKRGKSGYEAEKDFGIPRSTIMAHVAEKRGKKSKTMGRSTALPRATEKLLAENIHHMEKYGFGLSKQEVLELVGEYINTNGIKTPFKNGIPGHDWFTGFSQRNKLSIKKPQGVEYARKRICDPFIINEYFDILEKTMNDLGIENMPHLIWNLDETSFCLDPSKTKVVGRKGHPSTRTISSPGRNNTTVLLACSASGDKTPPLIVFKGKYIWDEWINKSPNSKTTYAATANGWMEKEVFENFFKNNFLPSIGSARPVLLIYDGHSTHLSINMIKLARNENVVILKIPPHSSHLLQPLDLSVMKSLKSSWDRELVKWQRLHVGSKLPKKEFSRLIVKIWNELDEQVILNGFQKSGISPFNREVIPKEKFDPLSWVRYQNHKWTAKVAEAVAIESPSTSRSVVVTNANESTLIYKHGLIEHDSRQIENNEKDKPITLSFKNLVPALKSSMQEAFPSTSEQAHSSTSQKLENTSQWRNINKNEQTIPNKSQIDMSFEVAEAVAIESPSTSRSIELVKLSNKYIFFNKHRLTEQDSGQFENNEKDKPKILSSVNLVPALKSSTQEAFPPMSEQAHSSTLQYLENTSQFRNIDKNEQTILGKSKIDVSFEELLLQRIKVNIPQKEKKTKVAHGSEVITSNEVLKRLEKERDEKEIKKKGIKRKMKARVPIKKKKGKKLTKQQKPSESNTSESEVSYDSENSFSDCDASIFFENILAEEEQEEKGYEETEQKCSNQNISIDVVREEDLQIGVWILVKFARKKSLKHYVGQIIGVDTKENRSYEIKFVRKAINIKREGCSVFSYPNVEDIYNVLVPDIVCLLSKPTIGRRGEIIFNTTFENFNVQ